MGPLCMRPSSLIHHRMTRWAVKDTLAWITCRGRLPILRRWSEKKKKEKEDSIGVLP
jgi:hypothetical protein